MTPVSLVPTDLTPLQRRLLERLADRPLPFAGLVELLRSADRLAEEATLPIRLDQALWPLLDGGLIVFERAEAPVARWADVIPTVQLLARSADVATDPDDPWEPLEAAFDLLLVLRR